MTSKIGWFFNCEFLDFNGFHHGFQRQKLVEGFLSPPATGLGTASQRSLANTWGCWPLTLHHYNTIEMYSPAYKVSDRNLMEIVQMISNGCKYIEDHAYKNLT